MSETLLLQCYEDLALQWHLMRPMEDPQPGRVFYAVDSNVIYSYLDSDEHRPSHPMDIGRLVRSDDRATRNALGRRLMARLMEAASPDVPLIMVTPIHGETKKILNEYLEHAAGVADGTVHHAKRLQEQLAALEDAPGAITRDLIERALRQHSGSILQRFQRLVRGRRLIPDAHVNAGTHGPQIASAIKPSSSIAEMFQFSQAKLAWRDRLLAVGRSETPLFEHDAVALTHIELINQRLVEMGSTDRLHYITQDSSLLRAGELHALPDDPFDFTRSYLRHPRAFVDAVGALEPIVQPETGQQQTMAGWLTVLLGRYEDEFEGHRLAHDGLHLPTAVREKVREVAAANPSAAEDIQTTWSSFAKVAADEPESFIETLQTAIRSRNVDELQALLVEPEGGETTAWEAVLEAGVATRFTVEVNVPGEIVAREPPPLIFDGRPALSAFLESARSWLADHATYDYAAYGRLRAAVRDEDPSGYGDFVVHAYLLAQQSQWQTARILARLASDSVCAHHHRIPQGSNGRESAYLEAHCLRMLARTGDELAAPKGLIEAARRIAAEEADHAGDTAFDACEERFDVELLAIDVAHLEFEWLESGGSDALAPAALALAERYAAIAESVRLKGTEDLDNALLQAARVDVVVRCCRAALALVLQFADLSDPSIASFDPLFEELKIAATGSGPRAEVTDAVLKLYEAARSPPTASVRRMLHGFALKHEGYPFDRARFECMVKRITELHGLK